MKISWKFVYAFCCVVILFLVPFVYADESVGVAFYMDNTPIQEVKTGDVVTLHSELVSANAADYIRFELQDSKLAFAENKSSNKINVYGKYNGSAWIYETKAQVLEDSPVLPKGIVIRDTSQPDLSETEKPTGLNIELNTEQIVSPGDMVSAKAVLEPQATVNANYYSYITWSVTYGDQVIDVPKGESLNFQIPEDALNYKINIKAVLKGSECGLGQDLASKSNELIVKDDSLSVQIFPSTEAEGVLKDQYIGFSSEILRNGKVAEASVGEKATYTWTSRIGGEYINGHRQTNTTYAIRPESLGTLYVSLKVTLKSGIELESNEVVKTVVDQNRNLESVNLRLVENGPTTVNSEVEVTKELVPEYSTDINGASYKWTATQDDKEIAQQSTSENFKFVPGSPGSVSITLEITIGGDKIIKSEPLIINITDSLEGESHPENGNDSENQDLTPKESTNPDNQTLDTQSEPEENPALQPDNIIHVVSGKIQTDQDLNKIYTGDTINVSANLETQGTDGNLIYHWQAQNNEGKILNQSNQLNSFAFTSDEPGPIQVTLAVKPNVSENNGLTDSIEDKSKEFKVTETFNILPKEEVGLNKEEANSDGGGRSGSADQVESPVNENPDSSTDQLESKGETTPVNKAGSETDTESEKDSEVETANQVVKEDNQTENPQTKPAGTTATTQYQQTPLQYTGGTSYSSGYVNSQTKAGPGTSSQNTRTGPTYSTSNLTSSPAKASSVFTQTSNIENPKTGVDFTIGQIAVITVYSLLIVIATVTLIRKAVIHKN